MSSQTEAKKKDEQGSSHVVIDVNGKEVRIHRGRTTVQEIKIAAECSPAFELEQVVDGKLVPLPDDQHIVLKGGEKFLCHPRDGASS